MSPTPHPTQPDALQSALSSPRIAGLDALRALAVFLVLADHSGWAGPFGLPVFDGGFGVMLFFVLSGFLITRGLLGELRDRDRIDLGRFYLRRAARLLPVFYAYLLAGAILLTLIHRPVPWGAIWSSSVYVINYYQAFTGAASHYLSHCWSLAVEEQFYMLWPLALLLVHRWVKVTWQGVLGLTLLLIGCRLAWVTWGASDEYLYRALETRGDQLAIGGLLACAMASPRARAWFCRIPARPWVLMACLGLIALSFNTFRGSNVLKYAIGFSIESWLVTFALPLVILLANQREHLAARLLNAGWVTWIGRISYGIYLFHPMVLHPVRHALGRAGLPETPAILLSMLAVALVAHCSFRWFEEPLRQRIVGLKRPTP
jgi:peptidoglycan/LPS O-acetylase OafA/YrhL